jgi:hypothetical protein
MRQKYRNMLASSFHYAILLLASMTLIKNQLGTNAMSTTASSSGCLVEGDMMFAPGQSYGAIMGFHCHNKSTYLGKQTICGTSGSMVDVENNFTCPNDAPNCVQCGDFSAVCISDMTAITEECASANGGSITTYPPVMNITSESDMDDTNTSGFGCLVEGDMMFAPGQSYGSIMGFHCHNKSTYLGKQTICGTSGSMVDVENNFTCPSHASNCVQCGDYSAICISDMTAVTEECASANGGSITSYPPVMNVTAELAATLVTSSTLVRRVSNLSSRLVPTLLLLSILL